MSRSESLRTSGRPPSGRVAHASSQHPGSTAIMEPGAQEEFTESAKEGNPTVGGSRSASRAATRQSRTGSRIRSPRSRLLLACTGVLAAGMFAVLFLNTILSQGAFRQYDLEIDLIHVSEQEEALTSQVQQAESALEVERRARALGMVPAAAPVFLRLSDGALLGEPVPAPEPTAPVDFADAPGIQPTDKPLPSPSPESEPLPSGAPLSGATNTPSPTSGLQTPETSNQIPSPLATPTSEAELP